MYSNSSKSYLIIMLPYSMYSMHSNSRQLILAPYLSIATARFLSLKYCLFYDLDLSFLLPCLLCLRATLRPTLNGPESLNMTIVHTPCPFIYPSL